MLSLKYQEIKLLRKVLPKFWTWANHKSIAYGIMQSSEVGRKAWEQQCQDLSDAFIETQVDVLPDNNLCYLFVKNGTITLISDEIPFGEVNNKYRNLIMESDSVTKIHLQDGKLKFDSIKNRYQENVNFEVLVKK